MAPPPPTAELLSNNELFTVRVAFRATIQPPTPADVALVKVV